MMNSVSLISLGLVGMLAAGAAPTAPAATSAIAATSAMTSSRPSCGTHVVADDADNGASVCVVVGSDVSILLTTVDGAPWSAPIVTGGTLGPALPLPTPFGHVGWQFRTIAAGTAEIRTTRPGGPSPAMSAPGCHDVVYRLHVTVR